MTTVKRLHGRGFYPGRGLLSPGFGQERDQPAALELYFWAGRAVRVLPGKVPHRAAVMGALGPSIRHLVEAVGTEELVIHRENIDGMAAADVALSLIFSKGLTGKLDGNSARNVPRWPTDASLLRVRQTNQQAGDRWNEEDAKGGNPGLLGSL